MLGYAIRIVDILGADGMFCECRMEPHEIQTYHYFCILL
jgi:hypothetical protein